MSYLNCPCCNSKHVKRNFISYNRINYKVCGNCGSSYQNTKVKINYTNTNWENFKDPDGNTRNLKNENF
jgi:transcription elongation factor Elf1